MTDASLDRPLKRGEHRNSEREQAVLDALAAVDRTWIKSSRLADALPYSNHEIAQTMRMLRVRGAVEAWSDTDRSGGSAWRLVDDPPATTGARGDADD